MSIEENLPKWYINKNAQAKIGIKFTDTYSISMQEAHIQEEYCENEIM